jgi:hypothetical protein
MSTWDSVSPQASDTRQAVPEHQEQQAPVAGRVAAAFGDFHELLDFGGNEVFAVAHHFVQCSGARRGRKPAPLLGSIFQQ